MEELGWAWSFDKLDLEQSERKRKKIKFTKEIKPTDSSLMDFHHLVAEAIENAPCNILCNVIIPIIKVTNPRQVSNKQVITKSVILLTLLCMLSNQAFCKCLKWSPSAGFHNVNSEVQRCTLLFNETKIHSNCKQYAFTQHKATLQNGHWWQLAENHHIPPTPKGKGFQRLFELSLVCIVLSLKGFEVFWCPFRQLKHS